MLIRIFLVGINIKFFYLFAAILLSLNLLSCSQSLPVGQSYAYSMSHSFYLTDDEVANLSSEAMKNNADANKRLANYYYAYRYDIPKLFFYMQRCAELGDCICKHNLSVIYTQSGGGFGEYYNQAEADYWKQEYLRDCAKAGDCLVR